MTRSYATPLAFKAALEARLHERAARQSRSLNRVRQLLVMERFLARVFPSEAAELRDEVLAVPGAVMNATAIRSSHASANASSKRSMTFVRSVVSSFTFMPPTLCRLARPARSP
jgi:hypothetical protein